MSKVTKKPLRRMVEGDIFARVRQMRPVAQKLLDCGITDDRMEFSEDILCEEPSGCHTDAEITELVQWTSAVYALGIAVGLLLRPEAFEKAVAK